MPDKVSLTADRTAKGSGSPKTPPHSIEAEQALLGAVMLDARSWDRICDVVSDGDFYRADHRVIFSAMSRLMQHNKPCDVLTVMEDLKGQHGVNLDGMESYLFELANSTPSANHISAYADIVRERSVLRQLVSTANDIADSAFHYSGQNVGDLLDSAEQKIFKIADKKGGSGQQEPQQLADYLARASEKIDALYQSNDPVTGLSTGFTDLDEMTSGLQPGELTVIAGRPSMGKTVLAVNIAESAAMGSKQPVLVFSLEMPGDSLAMRMISSLGRVDQHRVRTGKLSEDDWPRIASAVGMLSEAPVFIDDSPALSPGEVRARARRIAREHGQLKLIVVDYLQLMQVPGSKENRTLEISEISRSLKALAKELNVPVIALSQLNRGLEQRTDKRPMMSDLRESGAIEQDADLIIFIYRDEVYHSDSPYKGTAEIIIGKQRNGPIGKLRLTFLGQYTKFENHQNTDYLVEA